MAMPGVGALERGCVVHSVAGHGYGHALRLQRHDQPELVFRTGAGKYVRLHDRRCERCVTEPVEIGASQHLIRVLQADLPSDGGNRAGVVAGDHFHADAGSVAVHDGGDRFPAWRINQPDQAEQYESTFDVAELQNAMLGFIAFVVRGSTRWPWPAIVSARSRQ